VDPNHLPVADSAPYHEALEQCLDHWGLVRDRTSLLRDGVNHVFASETRGGAAVIVRISDGELRRRGEIEGELMWLGHLVRHGCTVTTPIQSGRGELLESVSHEAGVFHVACFERFAGRPLDPRHDPEWNDRLLLELGREIGRIHRASDSLRLPPAQDRRPWYASSYSTFPDPLPSCYDPRVAEAMTAFTREMRERPRDPRHFGLVHRDLHAGNFLVERGRVEIIDFDLGCYGWRGMDFAVLLFAHYCYPSLKVAGSTPEAAGRVLATLACGYREQHALDDEQLAAIDDLMKLHEIVNYVACMPALEHWQTAMGNPQPTVRESSKWIEKLWLEGREPQVDLSWL
jgi:Ser/Thr protein kinase RdoA (MazF antagonist)